MAFLCVVEYQSSNEIIESEISSVLEEKMDLVSNFIKNEEKEFYEVYDEELFLAFLDMEKDSSDYNFTKDIIMKKFNRVDNKSFGIINSEGVFILDKEPSLIGFNINSYPESVRYLEKAGPEINYIYHGKDDIYL